MLFMAATTASEIWIGSLHPVHRMYRIYEKPLTWHDAQRFCRKHEVDLATVGSLEEQKLLEETVGRKQSSYWSGLHKVETYQWGWSEGVGLNNVDNQNSGSGDCVWLEPDVLWQLDQCNNQRPFLCFDYDKYGNEQYTEYVSTESWQAAQGYCRQHHKDLATVKSVTQRIISHLKGMRFWIGLFRDTWRWSDGSPSSFRDWILGQPDNFQGAQACGVFNTMDQLHWDDVSCDSRKPFVCHNYSKIKRFVMKLTLISKVDPSLSAQRKSLLQQLQSRLKEEGVSDFKIGVRSSPTNQTG